VVVEEACWMVIAKCLPLVVDGHTNFSLLFFFFSWHIRISM